MRYDSHILKFTHVILSPISRCGISLTLSICEDISSKYNFSSHPFMYPPLVFPMYFMLNVEITVQLSKETFIYKSFSDKHNHRYIEIP